MQIDHIKSVKAIYSVWVFVQGRGPLVYRYVNDTKALWYNLSLVGFDIKYMNVYVRRTEKYLGRISNP